jgi:perosamine synthetase
MIPRGRLDIGWRDLAMAAASCLVPRRRDAVLRRVEDLWSPAGDALACLSVRSGLDLLLTALDHPRGTEVLVSAVTIRDIVRVIEDHGLVAVPVDIDMATLTLDMESLRRAVSPRTRLLLVAHLFGSRMPLSGVARFASERGLMLVEDCAQSFTGLGYRGHEASDVSMFSFGPLKTCSALGGALLRIKDPELRARMKALHSARPVQGRGRFLKRVVRFGAVRLAMLPLPYTAFCAMARLLGRNHDDILNQSIRGFSGPAFFTNIRHQPPYPMLALLLRRLLRSDGVRVERRKAAAAAFEHSLPSVPRPGQDAAHHSYWTFPIWSEAPDDLVRYLARRGFDSTRGAWSVYAVPAPALHPHLSPTQALEGMRRLVYIPVYPEVDVPTLERLAQAIDAFDRSARAMPASAVLSAGALESR